MSCTLKDFKLGDRVKVYTYAPKVLGKIDLVGDPRIPSDHTLKATIVLITNGGNVVLGWDYHRCGRDGERDTSYDSWYNLKVDNFRDYVCFFQAVNYRLALHALFVEGQKCSGCGLPCPHIEKADANYRCIGCRAEEMFEEARQ